MVSSDAMTLPGQPVQAGPVSRKVLPGKRLLLIIAAIGSMAAAGFMGKLMIDMVGYMGTMTASVVKMSDGVAEMKRDMHMMALPYLPW